MQGVTIGQEASGYDRPREQSDLRLALCGPRCFSMTQALTMSLALRLAARTVHVTSFVSGQALRRARRVALPRILMFHGIGPDDVPEAAFDWQLSCLKREFEVVSLEELHRRVAARQTSGDEVVITFDDGVQNHASMAYPPLLAHGLCATFFVCPGNVESGQWIWNMEMRARLMRLSTDERQRLVQELGAPHSAAEDLAAWCKQLGPEARQAAETAVRSVTQQFEPTAYELDRFAPMSWQTLRSLDPALITLGSHTSFHPILTTLPPDAQRDQLVGSRKLLEERLGRPVRTFCYPNGDHDPQVVTQVRNAYDIAVTTVPGYVGDNPDPVRLPRIAAGDTRSLFLRRLHRPTA